MVGWPLLWSTPHLRESPAAKTPENLRFHDNLCRSTLEGAEKLKTASRLGGLDPSPSSAICLNKVGSFFPLRDTEPQGFGIATEYRGQEEWDSVLPRSLLLTETLSGKSLYIQTRGGGVARW